MIVGQLNLAMFQHVVKPMKNKKGEMVDCLILPIESNNFFKSEKGNVFLDIVAFDAVNEEFEQTHAVKQSFSKAKREEMGEDAIKAKPFIGNLNANKPAGAQPNTIEGLEPMAEGEDDLPF